MIVLPVEKGKNHDYRVNIFNLVNSIAGSFSDDDLNILNKCCKEKKYTLEDVKRLSDNNILSYIFVDIIDNHFAKYITRLATIKHEIKYMSDKDANKVKEFKELSSFIYSYGY